jgi:hypothetical protein
MTQGNSHRFWLLAVCSVQPATPLTTHKLEPVSMKISRKLSNNSNRSRETFDYTINYLRLH